MVRIDPPEAGSPLAIVISASAVTLDSIDSLQLLPAYRRYGALLLRGFPFTPETFGRFCRSLCPTAVINESPGRARITRSDAVQSVDLGTDAFPLHPELSREPWRPDVAIFACLSPPGSGGETTLCDGTEIAAALPGEVYEALAPRRLLYLMPTWPALFEFWLGTTTPDGHLLANPPADCPYRFLQLRSGQIVRAFSRPALQRPLFVDKPAFGNFLLFARYQLGRRDFPLFEDWSIVPDAVVEAAGDAADRLTYAHGWEKHDILILDNSRFMHGRRAILDAGERSIITYFGFLKDVPADSEGPGSPVWRRQDFAPPLNPAMAG